MEEQTERYQASANCDTGGSVNVWPAQYQLVVRRPVVSKIMHLCNSRASAYPADYERRVSSDCAFATLVEPIGHQQPKEDYDNWEDRGHSCVGRAVVELDLLLAMAENDGAVTDEMHAPDGHQSKRD